MQASSGFRDRPSFPPDTSGRDSASVRFRKQTAKYRIEYLYHLTHCDNLPNIYKFGLLSHNGAHAKFNPVDISDPSVNGRRADRRDGIYNRPLHAYVPLYFTPRNPMLYVRRDQQHDLAVICIDKDLLLCDGTVFTDGNAASDGTKFFRDTQDLRELDWECIRAEYWTEHQDGRRKRCAEVLVPDKVGSEHFRCVVVINDDAARKVREIVDVRVWNRPRWFFTK